MATGTGGSATLSGGDMMGLFPDRARVCRHVQIQADADTEIRLMVNLDGSGFAHLHAVAYRISWAEPDNAVYTPMSSWKGRFELTPEMLLLLDDADWSLRAKMMEILLYRLAVIPAMDDPSHWIRTVSPKFWSEIEKRETARRNRIVQEIQLT